MKKFLVLFIALVMALSCVLVSCDKGGETPDNTDDGAWIPQNTPAVTTPAATTAPEAGNKPSSDYTWTDDAAGTTVYVRIDAVNVRSDTLVNDNTKVATAKFGDSFKRIKYNDQWTVISYNGQERYISTPYVTTDNGSVVFDEVAEKTMYINVEATLNLRTSTFVTNPDGTKYEDNIATPVKRGVAVVQIGVSKNGNWAKIKYDGNTLYCNTAYLSETEPGDETVNTPVVPAPVG